MHCRACCRSTLPRYRRYCCYRVYSSCWSSLAGLPPFGLSLTLKGIDSTGGAVRALCESPLRRHFSTLTLRLLALAGSMLELLATELS